MDADGRRGELRAMRSDGAVEKRTPGKRPRRRVETVVRYVGAVGNGWWRG